jgi:hypothetical protein
MIFQRFFWLSHCIFGDIKTALSILEYSPAGATAVVQLVSPLSDASLISLSG